MEIRKYDSIPNIYKVSDGLLAVGDIIHVSEKIDGANASFRMDDSGIVHYYSRNTKLSEDNGLRGFVSWCEENVEYEEVRSGYIFYGEWVVRHKINYTAEIANTFVLFDIYNAEEDKYLNPVSVEIIA
ncbi:MAG: RNA ligase family protein, partial [Cetobacterium sp.]